MRRNMWTPVHKIFFKKIEKCSKTVESNIWHTVPSKRKTERVCPWVFVPIKSKQKCQA